MCGICGIATRSGLRDQHKEHLNRMSRALEHRGPDGYGEHVDGHVALAMRRLAIIDLEGGWQPIYNENRDLALVANGEIYNFMELRSTLEGKGHVFRTNSDCETIVHCYEEYGSDFVQHLRGMFACALWDVKARRLVLARDRMGEKPLYLHEHDGVIHFSSELKSLIRSGAAPFELDPGSICDFFHYEYVPDPKTALKGVRKLAAGHIMTIDCGNWDISESCYWSIEDAEPLEGDPVDLIRNRLDDISDIILRADVPVGISLSAGLDSSALAVLCSRRQPGQIHALTAAFEGAGWRDECSPAARLAQDLGMPFHSVKIGMDEMLEDFPADCIGKDDPIADIASHGYAAIFRLARENGIPVLLQGQGADELFWGYKWLRRALDASNRKFSAGLPPVPEFAGSRNLLPNNLHFTGLRDYAFLLAGKVAGWSRMPDQSPDMLRFYEQSKTYQMGAYAAERIFTDSYNEALEYYDPAGLFTIGEPRPPLPILLSKLAAETYLRENGIAQGDRLSMLSSVELRLPLVDHKLIETVIGLRKNYHDHHLEPKYWFREAVKDYLPDWVLSRPKTGFSPPSTLWMNALRNRYGSKLLDGYLVEHSIIKRSAVAKMLSSRSQLTAWPTTLFKTLVLEYWARGMAKLAS
jgi:asparagine synthase (glutamine-hydrolysing)